MAFDTQGRERHRQRRGSMPVCSRTRCDLRRGASVGAAAGTLRDTGISGDGQRDGTRRRHGYIDVPDLARERLALSTPYLTVAAGRPAHVADALSLHPPHHPPRFARLPRRIKVSVGFAIHQPPAQSSAVTIRSKSWTRRIPDDCERADGPCGRLLHVHRRGRWHLPRFPSRSLCRASFFCG